MVNRWQSSSATMLVAGPPSIIVTSGLDTCGHAAAGTPLRCGSVRGATGSGAAGGVGFAARELLGASLDPGFEVLGTLTGLEDMLSAADLVVTGEGRLDDQTMHGKTPMGVAALCRSHAVPVVAVCQLNRGPEQRTDKKPQVSDLRESGSLEQDADMVILLHRPDAFERDDPRAGEADIIVGKHRNGPTATITVAHQLHLSRFVDMARG